MRAGRPTAIATALLAVSIVVECALFSVHLLALDLGFYRTEWIRHGVPEATSMDMDELVRAGRALTDYFTKKAQTPQIQARIDGSSRPLYNETELTHLEDVKSLFSAGFLVEEVLAVEMAGLLLYLVRSGNRRSVQRSFAAAGGLSLGIAGVLAVAAGSDFTGWWTRFHLVTFTNDLWRLDPATDWLIRMFPEEFFYSAVKRIGLYSSGFALLCLALGLLVRHFPADHRHKNR